MRYARVLLPFTFALIPLGCAEMQPVPQQPKPQAVSKEPPVSVKPLPPAHPVTVQPRPTPPYTEPPAADETTAEPTQPPPPAVLALLTEAERNRSQGNLDTAAATLERALRIEPRNAELWHQLASVRLQQHKPGLAEDLAKKSNTLAYRNNALKRKNWELIAQARRLQGDREGAQDAENKARAQ